MKTDARSEAMGNIEELANDVRGLGAVLVAVATALAYEKLGSTELPDQPVTLGSAEGWLDWGVQFVFDELDAAAGRIQDLACKAKVAR
jgi:hypothetical protein